MADLDGAITAVGDPLAVLEAVERPPVSEDPAADPWGARVRALYASVDANKNGKLDWDELRGFQDWTYQRFRYRTTARPLVPRDFLTMGSGDCKSFALFTEGLLRYWGIRAYIGSLRFADPERVGHALVLIGLTQIPEGMEWFSPRGLGAGGAEVPPGRYIPVDYNLVGAVTDAVKPGMGLASVVRGEDYPDWY